MAQLNNNWIMVDEGGHVLRSLCLGLVEEIRPTFYRSTSSFQSQIRIRYDFLVL